MPITDISAKNWILTVFKRSDGERFILGSGDYEFEDEQLHFTANEIENDVVELQGADGQILAGQVQRSSSQDFDGFIGDGTYNKRKVEVARRNFLKFFNPKYKFDTIYISCLPNGETETIVRKRGYITDTAEVRELYQYIPKYHVALAYEDVNYYQYKENSDGDEIFANQIELIVSGYPTKGLTWDEKGVVWNDKGAKWEGTVSPNTQTITNNGIRDCYIVLEANGETINPTLQNLTTGEIMQYQGLIEEGSTLVIDTINKTVELNGENVFSKFRGSWITLKTGENKIKYLAENNTPATLKFNEIVG